MSIPPPDTAAPQVSDVSLTAPLSRMGDCELLERFADRCGKQDESAELAFAMLVARHGPMVLRVCRAGLGDLHDAEDAFQATFLVLARRAASIRQGRSIGSWLHGVALRVTACARMRSIRRQHHERRRGTMISVGTSSESQNQALDDETGQILHEEINRLPERFRSAVILCYLEGLTHDGAADQLGCPVGTIRSRLATARDRLRRQLALRGLTPAAESAVLAMSVPTALVDTTVRGALRVGLGNAALTGIATAESVALSEAVLKSLATTKLVWTTTALFAALSVTGLGVSTYFTKRPNGPTASGGVNDLKPAHSKDSPDPVKTLLQASDSASRTFETSERQAKTPDEHRSLVLEHQKKLDSYADALLQIAESNRATPRAEQALIGIVTKLRQSSKVEQALDIITREYVTSKGIEPLLYLSGLFTTRAVEALYRDALAKNPDRQIQGLACYELARYLDVQAGFYVLRQQRNLPPAPITEGEPTKNPGGREGAQERLRALGPDALEQEATALYERVVTEFGDIPSAEPPPNLTDHELRNARSPASLGVLAQFYLNDHRTLGIGRTAPEIEGVDLDDRPMKLSDYRGKVVVLYFGGPVPPSSDAANRVAAITQAVQKVAERHAADPFELLGVSTFDPGPSAGREAYRASLKARAMPARFWWDLDPFNQPGPIQTAWNARGRTEIYVLDHRGVIRFKHYFGDDALERAVETLIKEQKDELVHSKKPEIRE